MTPYLEACFGGGGRIGVIVTGISKSIRGESDWECDYEHEPESTGSGTFLSYPAGSALADVSSLSDLTPAGEKFCESCGN